MLLFQSENKNISDWQHIIVKSKQIFISIIFHIITIIIIFIIKLIINVC